MPQALAKAQQVPTCAAGELQRRGASGEDDRIKQGEYSRRGAETEARPIRDDLSAAGNYYAKETRETVDHVVDASRHAAGRVGEAFTNAQK